MATSKRIDLDLDGKVQLLRDFEVSGITQMCIARKYGVSKSQVSRLVSLKNTIFAQFEEGNKKRKWLRSGKEEDVGNALFLWFKQKLTQGARLSGTILKQKASEIAAVDGSEFVPSDGWLGRWKIRHSLTYKQEQGEKQDANVQRAENWKHAILPTIMEDFTKEDIFNADETGLYFRCFPDKGYSVKGDELPGGKKVKDRVTVMLCANMSGSEKIPLLVIGKSKRPRSFPKDLSKLPVQYQTSKNAWMTGYIFEWWLKNWDNTLRSKKRKVCLLVDNCSAHSKSIPLTNIVLKFLPATPLV